MNALTKAALIRAHRSAVEYITSSIPAGFVVTPVMLQKLNMKYLIFIILAWFITGVIHCAIAFFWAVEQGLPEVQGAEEARSVDVMNLPVLEYSDDENYDFLHIDDDVDEGDDDDVE